MCEMNTRMKSWASVSHQTLKAMILFNSHNSLWCWYYHHYFTDEDINSDRITSPLLRQEIRASRSWQLRLNLVIIKCQEICRIIPKALPMEQPSKMPCSILLVRTCQQVFNRRAWGQPEGWEIQNGRPQPALGSCALSLPSSLLSHSRRRNSEPFRDKCPHCYPKLIYLSQSASTVIKPEDWGFSLEKNSS